MSLQNTDAVQEQGLKVQQQLAQERDRLRLLLEVNHAVISHLDPRELMRAISACLRRAVPHDEAILNLYDTRTDQLRIAAIDPCEYEDFLKGGGGTAVPLDGTLIGPAFTSGQPIVRKGLAPAEFPSSSVFRHFIEDGMRSGCAVPLISHHRTFGVVSMLSRREEAFCPDEMTLLTQVAQHIAIAVENALTYFELERLKRNLAEETQYLQEELQTDYNFEQIIGKSAALKGILAQSRAVAPTNSTVLIQGETGTGKELIARAIHNLSPRRKRTFVKINCAAIPTGLLESELFGHERGAFTGAIRQRIGRFELAHGGTLFLDEVGELPRELQAKLLRVLQEQAFERVGGTRTIRVDVRIVAATNADLEQMVTEKQFRLDLYYRLKVFPITIPPLRNRPEDIKLLAQWFAQKFARQMNKQIETISADAESALTNYHWPGNVRELENVIERAVILSQVPTLTIPSAELKPVLKLVPSEDSTLECIERDHILSVLQETNGVVSGPAGAAARLGLNRSTLQSKMRKLGIHSGSRCR